MPLRLPLILALSAFACSPYEGLDGFPGSKQLVVDRGETDTSADPQAPADDAGPNLGDRDDPVPIAGVVPSDDGGGAPDVADAGADPGAGTGEIEGGGGPAVIDDGDDLVGPPNDEAPTPNEQDPPGPAVCTPVAEICDGVDNDCDGQVDDGFDKRRDARNCGGCGVVCDVPGGEPSCDDSACVIARCLDGFYDVDGDPSNGCEVERAGRTLYVDITAIEGGDGSLGAPLTQIIDAAQIADEGDIIEVRSGFYDGPVVMNTPFVTVHGAGNLGTWIDGDGGEAPLQIAADDVRIRRLSIDAGGAESAITAIDQERFSLNDLRLTHVQGDAAAVLILGGAGGRITELAISDVRGDGNVRGLRVQGHQGLYAGGIEISEVSGGARFCAGITLTGADGARLRGIEISGISGDGQVNGVLIDASADADIEGITVTDLTGEEATAISLFESADARLRDVEITDVAGRSATGLHGERAHFLELTAARLSNIAAVTAPGDEAAGRAYGMVVVDTADATAQRTLIHDISGHRAFGVIAEALTERFAVGYSTIAGVTAVADGAAMEVREGATAIMSRCIVASGGTRQGLRNDEANPTASFSADTTDSFGHPQGNFVGLDQGEGNVEIDPLFTDADEADYTLAAGSPVTDRGAHGVELRLLP